MGLKPQRKSVCLLAGGIIERNLRLQPWRYLYEICRGLAEQGHEITILSDGGNDGQVNEMAADVSIIRLPSVRNPFWRQNAPLQEELANLSPDIILWHVGMISFLHQRLEGPHNIPIVGIFTSPVYRFNDLARLGIRKILRGYSLTALHLLGTLLPRRLFRKFILNNNLISLVVQTETTRHQLVEQELWMGDIQVIPPGVDQCWCLSTGPPIRNTLGYKPDETVIVYFGSPAPLRGLPALLKAFSIARNSDSSLKLLILSRRRPGELRRESTSLTRFISANKFHQDICIIDGYLDKEELIHYVAAGDIVALPFELVPSDAPLSLLEACALGKPVVTTRVACLPELVSNVEHYLAEPANPVSLSQALLQAAKDHRRSEIVEDQSCARSWTEMAGEWTRLVQNL
jgi:glycosyltransferase involved in cell wall biosynthesis